MPWQFIGKRTGDFMKNHLLYESYVDNFKKVFDRNHPDFLTVREKDTFAHYLDIETFKEASMFILEQAKNHSFLEFLLGTGKQKYENLLNFCRTLSDVKGFSGQALAALVKEYFILYREPYPYFMATVFVDVLEEEDVAREVVDIMAKLRYIGRDSFNKAHKLSHPLFLEIGKKLNLTVEQVKFLKPEEIEKSLVQFDDMIKKRQTCYFVHKDGKFELRENESYEIKEEIVDDAGELKGQGTFPAFYKGKVRLVNSKDDLKNIKKGEVIVTRMTTPDLVTESLKKAGAIITDEGGITCHAAIVSREFKIPCVTGTKIATRVLKEGDLIEVNAEKGVVKRIK